VFGLVWLLSQDKAALGKFAEKLQDDDNSGPISDLDKLKVTKEKVLYSFLVFLICRLHSHICQTNRTGAMLKVLAFPVTHVMAVLMSYINVPATVLSKWTLYWGV
jgi:hypothetical protein